MKISRYPFRQKYLLNFKRSEKKFTGETCSVSGNLTNFYKIFMSKLKNKLTCIYESTEILGGGDMTFSFHQDYCGI